MALSSPSRVHLSAGLAACFAAALALTGAFYFGRGVEARYIHGLAPEVTHIKNQGIALQRQAFAEPDLLPFYGSSELVKPIPDKASQFFRHYPTNFEVFPVGKAGTASLNILQKLAAVGDGARGRKVAISLSPSWFFMEMMNPRYYDGNYSKAQASALVFRTGLSFPLKRDIARRMLEYPRSMERDEVLAFALRRLAGGGWIDRLLYEAVEPLGWLESEVYAAQDHCESALYILRQRHHLKASPHRRPGDIDWEEYLAKAASRVAPAAKEPDLEWLPPTEASDADFRKNLAKAKEWGDLELLIRTLKELGAEPLFLSMPVNAPYYVKTGVAKESLDGYVSRLRQLMRSNGVGLIDFEEHEDDPKFLADHHDHLSVKGWMYYNKALDEFFHSGARL